MPIASVLVLPSIDEERSRPERARVIATVASAVVSLALHGSVLAATLYWAGEMPGAIDSPTEAITVELLQTEVIESVTDVASLEAQASPESVQSNQGEIVESAASSVSTIREVKPETPPEEVVARDVPDEPAKVTTQGVEALRGALESETPIGAEEPAKRTNEEIPRQTKQEKRPQKTVKLTEPSAEQERNSEAKRKGAAQTRTNKGSAASKGRASASTGSSINYAAIVRARVASRKPAGGGKRGTVVIAFGVSRSGGLSFASVARSSGDPSLDRSVLAAVRGAGPFPAPPPGAGLRFAMPFYFK